MEGKNKKLLTHSLFVIDYNNGHFKEVQRYRVTEQVFKKDWTQICNSMTTSKVHGLNCFSVQDYMQQEKYYFNMYPRTMTLDEANHYINANNYNKTNCKLVKHSNIGNY